MIAFIISHPLYVPFLILNAVIVYKIIRDVLSDLKEKNDDGDNGGIFISNEPVLDLPPGVTLPISTNEPVLND